MSATIRSPGMSNADYLRALRADASARGLCYVCRCRFPRPGVRTCDECLGRGAKWKTTTPQGQETSRKHGQASHARRAAKRIAAGLCPRCGRRPPEVGRASCSICLDATADRNRDEYRAKNPGSRPYGCAICNSPDHQSRRHERPGAFP